MPTPCLPADVDEAAGVLAAAFEDDPALSWMVADDRTRLRRLRRMYATQIRHHHLPGGGVEVVRGPDGAMMGAAVWDPPNGWRQSRLTALRTLPSNILALGRHMRTARLMDEALGAAHPDTPHWFLESIGTDPAGRGGGYGKALLTSRLDRCDDERMPAYLESSKHSNIPFYERYGFTVVQEVALPNGPSLWTMWREPR